MIINKRKALSDFAQELKTPNQSLAKIKKITKEIIKLQVDLNTRIYKGKTLLHYAVMGKNGGVIPFLVKCGVNPNLSDDNYNTPLHFAIMKNAYYAVCELVKIKNVDIDALGEFDQTPLHKAVIYGNLDIIKVLVKNGADTLLVDEKNQSPLDYAKDEGDEAIIKFLESINRKEHGNARNI